MESQLTRWRKLIERDFGTGAEVVWAGESEVPLKVEKFNVTGMAQPFNPQIEFETSDGKSHSLPVSIYEIIENEPYTVKVTFQNTEKFMLWRRLPEVEAAVQNYIEENSEPEPQEESEQVVIVDTQPASE